MEQINWVQVIIGFLGGGACGAFIKQYFDNRRNRVQPIGKSIEIKSFYDSVENTLLNSQVILTGSTQEYKFSKLYTGTIKIANTGLHDYSSFTFGITCPENVNFIHIRPESTDRHHLAEIKDLPTLENQINSFDITLKPFNRKDNYTFDILVTATDVRLKEEDIKISSPHPINWVDLTSSSKIVLEIARESLVRFGPLSIGLR
ncbi:hypothetical protein [Pontibacter anaerobius]|uniref:Uncharacterized protein n=1 Tax=Pontibacter anaerobius TaxID=2993940 RepID=A0ABT3RJM0_9BACT|nr:hypothetical protein [Pontibacter anaerobius]MCX2741706.1 hypothetical protein [Pontibacter anaerobius]